MTTLILNNDVEHAVEITTFTRSTAFGNENGLVSSIITTIVPSKETLDYLHTCTNTITDLKIIYDGEEIYHLANTSITIVNIDESLNANKISTTINMSFGE